jgi:hypothetical protein
MNFVEDTYWNAGEQSCHTDDGFVFIQYSCEMSEGQKHDKYNKITLSVVTVMAIAVIFILTIWYVSNQVELGSMEYDVKTIVTGDYTVELDISKDMFDNFANNYYLKYKNKLPKGDNGLPKVLVFKQYLKEEI